MSTLFTFFKCKDKSCVFRRNGRKLGIQVNLKVHYFGTILYSSYSLYVCVYYLKSLKVEIEPDKLINAVG